MLLLARFTDIDVSFTLPPEALSNDFNVTFHLRDPSSPNSATIYADDIRFTLDAIIIKPNLPIGAIVGAVIGGVAIIVLGFLAWWRWGRQRHVYKPGY